MQTAHATFDLRRVNMFDPALQRRLDKDTCEEANHASSMEQTVCFARRHEIIDALREMVSPSSVLMRHVLLFA